MPSSEMHVSSGFSAPSASIASPEMIIYNYSKFVRHNVIDIVAMQRFFSVFLFLMHKEMERIFFYVPSYLQ